MIYWTDIRNIENKNTLKDMGKKANQVAIQNVEEKIYKEIKEL